METISLNSAADEVLEQIGLKDVDEFELMVMILTGHDDALKTGVLKVTGEARDERYIPFIGKLINSPDTGVQKMAVLRYNKWIIELEFLHGAL